MLIADQQCEQLSLSYFIKFFNLTAAMNLDGKNTVAALTGGVVCLIHNP
jgi:hypothetical protein